MILDVSAALHPSVREFPGAEEDLRVLLAYADTTVCARALKILHRVAAKVPGSGRVVCSGWKFRFLGDPSLQGLALREAANADVIAIATQDESELPEGVNQWLAQWLSTKEDRPMVLAAVIGQAKRPRKSAGTLVSRLREVARLGCVDFVLAGSDDLSGTSDPGEITRHIARRANSKGRQIPAWSARQATIPGLTDCWNNTLQAAA